MPNQTRTPQNTPFCSNLMNVVLRAKEVLAFFSLIIEQRKYIHSPIKKIVKKNSLLFVVKPLSKSDTKKKKTLKNNHKHLQSFYFLKIANPVGNAVPTSPSSASSPPLNSATQ